MPYAIAELNQMSQDAFVAALGAVFEDTPTIAYAAWGNRPFSDLASLHQTMVKVVQEMPADEQLRLICAHPDLGSKAKMADASVREQAGVGLDQLSPTEFEQFHTLNQQYRERFGFPFIIAVKNHTKSSILTAFAQRLQHDSATERQQALTEIIQIARFRLESLVN
ncbi:MAG: 2-oxo-4-hydroxy-4-carboxy-5-ureidoimidazoline decarboxylase [Leptolyngbyaceae cyanobacterium bins.302]|nr:2-oxo-4-hydroxy-4-carboxy-5-ureidoimidazoline decarboxylase [Leptolyngbyaceae cyanobacterium bins.302]